MLPNTNRSVATLATRLCKKCSPSSEAMAGRPGPSTWEAGSYPPGQENYPVSGASWYEAAAYAEFAGTSLPTVAHWLRASNLDVVASDLRFLFR
jgi:formylglycine-generating enzyme required for sulfatase activity